MRSSSVLVLGKKDNPELIENLLKIGLSPLVRETIQNSIYELRHEQFAGILVDNNSTNADVLEFVLNVRDIDGEIPIAVLGPANDPLLDNTLSMQDNVTVLDNENSSFAEQLERTLDNNR